MASTARNLPRVRRSTETADWKKRGWKTAAKKPVKNVDLWQQLDAAVQAHEVAWYWVKGHTGEEGNEQADALANQAIDEMLGSN